uniref:NADH dehydrogenase subunit 4L n=1 Tax=Euaspis polynesia TaxID=1352276 RepID=A0A7T4WNW0_9HYME|nr:NADH dehydrogenase subunit 4L [Euaspis polynesia]QQD78165.1 NADH dehydrogenase subunit 4L [Euaspis polynesia]
MFKGYFFILMILCLINILSFKKSFLMFLISLEFFTLINLMMIMLINIELNEIMFMYYMMIAVCEVVIGISVMISMYKYSGSDMFMKMNMKC